VCCLNWNSASIRSPDIKFTRWQTVILIQVCSQHHSLCQLLLVHNWSRSCELLAPTWTQRWFSFQWFQCSALWCCCNCSICIIGSGIAYRRSTPAKNFQ
jgi:hypothetical protein